MSASPRIALLMHSVLPRGGVVHTLELAGALAAAGTAVDVLAPVEPGQALFRPLPSGVGWVPLAVPAPRASGLAEQVGQRIDALVQALPAALQRGGYALLHAQDSLNGQALAQLAPAQPWVRTVHHLDDFSDPRLAAWQDGAWRAASAVCCVSDLWARQLRTLAGPEGPPVHRVFNGVALDRFHPGPVASDATLLRQHLPEGRWVDEAPFILAVGGVEARKNSTRLLQAFARLRQHPSFHGARLVLAGGASLLSHSAEQARWQAALDEAGLAEGPRQPVWRTGPLRDALLPALMRQARLLAMPSLNEGFGLVALEALACGTPVLVSRRAPFTEHLADSPGVSWCEPEDLASLSLGLASAWHAPRLSTAPPVCERLAWRRSALAHQTIHAHVLAGRPSPREPETSLSTPLA